MKGSSVNPGSSLPGSTSSSLLARLRQRDRDAWVRLANLYGPLVYSWCRRRGLQADDAADVVQEVFRAVLEHLPEFTAQPDGSFRGWLWTITRNKLMDYFRRGQRHVPAAGGTTAQQQLAEVPAPLDESAAEPGQAGGLVRRALELIRPDFEEASWQAFWRVVMEDQPCADVARALGLTLNAVYIAKSRVLRRLREELGEDFP